MIKNLIVCGCSYTGGHLLSKEESWGGYVANKKQWELHNLGRGGSGNEWISQQTIAYIESNPELKSNSVVMIGWSDMGRMAGIFQPDKHYAPSIRSIRTQDFISTVDSSLIEEPTVWKSDDYDMYAKKYGDILLPLFPSFTYAAIKTYLAIFTLKIYLKHNNIPYIFFDTISHNKLVSIKYYCDSIADQIDITIKDGYGKNVAIREVVFPGAELYFNKNFESAIFEDDKYINFNGHCMLTEMRRIDNDPTDVRDWKYLTEGNENHPNNNACDYFSDMIIEKYNSLYT